jgi:hypothetical protein
MDFLYHLSGFLVTAVIVIGTLGLIRPSLLMKPLKSHATRRRIAVGMLISVFVFGAILSATEPEYIKAARAESERQAQATQQLKDQETAKVKAIQDQPKVEKKTVTEKQIIPFAEEQRQDATLPKGQTKVVQEGVNGEKTLTYEVTYTNGAESSRVFQDAAVTLPATAKVVALGTYVYVASPAPKPVTKPAPAPTPSTSAYYKNCTAVRAAGKAPIYRGQPGYASHLDRDGDGIGCEN